LLAVVLIIALIVVILLSWFPGVSADTRISESRSYWMSARPFSITEHRVAGKNITLVILNTKGERITLNNITIDGYDINISSVTFGGGEARAVNGTLKDECGDVGRLFEYDVAFYYDTKEVKNIVFTSGKPLIGRCS